MVALMLMIVVLVVLAMAFSWFVSQPLSVAYVASLPVDVKVEMLIAKHQRVSCFGDTRGCFLRVDWMRAHRAMLMPSLGDQRMKLVRSIEAVR